MQAKTESLTYKQAIALAKKNKGNTYTNDAGNGWVGVHYWCAWRNRIISKLVRKSDGFEII